MYKGKCYKEDDYFFLQNIFIDSLGISQAVPQSHSLSFSLQSTLPLLCFPAHTKKYMKSNLCFSYSHWSVVKLSVAVP